MNMLQLSLILFHFFLILIVGIFMYLLRKEVYKIAQQLHMRIPHPLARFLRITVMLPLFLMFGLLSIVLLNHLFF